MKQLVLLFLSVVPLLHLTAQTTDPELAEKLKSVMLLFDKNQQALKEEIIELNSSNAALTRANLNLYRDLQSAEDRIRALESENLLLRSKISEVAVRELEAASLQPTTGGAPPAIRNLSVAPRPRNPQTQSTPMDNPVGNQVNKALININKATLEELATLPAIDETMAEQIIANRPYETIEDLIINQGFGAMKLRRVTPFITAE